MARRTTRNSVAPVSTAVVLLAVLVVSTNAVAGEHCNLSRDCRKSEACIDYRCRDPCPGVCGARAVCTVRTHDPICNCPVGSTGDPFISCSSVNEHCNLSSDCRKSEACLANKCRDPCPGVCGARAVCTVRNHVPVCSCPVGSTGDPFVSCSSENECKRSSDCKPSEACLNGECQDPCTDVCGTGATCTVRNHFPACSCPVGTTGDPFESCKSENRAPATAATTTAAPAAASTPASAWLPALHRRCLRCLCEASTTCNLDFGCQEGYCGPFGVSHAYWNEAGRPVHPNDDPQSDQSFEDCAKEYECGSRIVHAYINKLKKDCNEDGLINCDDFAMMHHNGGYSCHLPLNRSEGGKIFQRRYLKCKGEDEDDDPLGLAVGANLKTELAHSDE